MSLIRSAFPEHVLALTLSTAAALSFQENPPPVSPKIVHLIAAARPNFMKVAPALPRARRAGVVPPADRAYRAALRREHVGRLLPPTCTLPEPAHHLEVGSGTHAEQTGRTMIAYEAVCQRERPE